MIQEVRNKAGNCDASVTTAQDAPCCQLGLWNSGTCEPDGTLTKTRTVSSLCPSSESSLAQEACCYKSDWTTAPNAICDITTGAIAQVRLKAGNCDSSVTTSQIGTCCQLGEWISGSCQPSGTISLSKYCPNKMLRRKRINRILKPRKILQRKCIRY